MQYKDFLAEDFAKDKFFIRWVNEPDEDSEWFWQSFQTEHPEKMRAVEEARKIIKVLDFPIYALPDGDFKSLRNKIIMDIKAEKEDESKLSLEKNVLRKFSWLKVAAVISIPLSIFATLYYFARSQNDLKTFATHPSAKKVQEQTESRVNPKGQKSVLILSDGSKVWLNADSRIIYDQNFSNSNIREVFLEGEAFFDVAKNPNKPFIVHTSDIHIKVLGTSFNVKSYHEDKTIETTLVHGKVSISKTGDDIKEGSLVLKPNQRAVFSKQEKTINIEQVLSERASLWRYDKLIFDETPFRDVIIQLERWYDVRFHFDPNAKLECNLTAEIGNETLEEVLALLQASQNIDYEISDKDVFIKGTFCK